MIDQAVVEATDAPAPQEPDADPRPSLEQWRDAEEEARHEDDASARGHAALKREWGESYDDRIAAARRLALDVATPELVAAIDRAGLGDDPHFLRAVAGLAERVYGAAPAGGGEVQDRLDELHALQHHADPRRRAQYRSRAVQDELQRLYTAIYGDRPVVGHARTR